MPTSNHTSFGKKIAVIYFYLLSAISIGLIIVGIFHIANFIINTTQYDQYPVRYAAQDCENPYLINPKGPYPMDMPVESTPSAGEMDRQKQACIKQAELDRKQHKIDDLKNATLFTLIGIVLFLIHYPQARKQSSD